MDVEEHLEVFPFACKFFLQFLADYLDFKGSIPVAFRVFVGVEMSVHVFTLQVGPVVATDHAVWVHDWNDPGFVKIAEFVTDELF